MKLLDKLMERIRLANESIKRFQFKLIQKKIDKGVKTKDENTTL